MALYFVDYDLRKAKDYSALITELQNLGGIRYLRSAWSLKRVNTSCAGLRDHLAQFIDNDDGLMVSEVTDWAGRALDATPHST